MLSIRFLLACLLLLCAGCRTAMLPQSAEVKTGLEVLESRNFDLLKGKRVGLITNATGVNSNLISTVDLFYAAENVNLTALFAPEHGIRGEIAAGEKVADYTDKITGVAVYSLYGNTRKPTPQMLDNVDVMVYDIQDIGVRSYTFISTMALAMEAAAELGIDFVVLDRPNPLGGEKIEGSIAEADFISFVSPLPIPYIYGLTVGELAIMINEEGWLKNGIQANLTVIIMEGWNRAMAFEQTGLPWVPTSPHIPHAWSPYFYVATGIMGELGVFSEGVGSTLPFQVMAAKNVDERRISQKMNAYNLPGVQFRPVVYKPFYGRDAGQILHGVQIHFTDYHAAKLMPIQFYFMQAMQELYPEINIFDAAKERWRMFDLVNGSDEIRLRFSETYSVQSILPNLTGSEKAFRELSSQYYLYK